MLARLRSFGARRVAVVVLALGLVGVVAVPAILAAPATQPTQHPVQDVAAVAAADDLSAANDLAAAVGSGTTTARPAALAGRLGRVLRADATVLKKNGTTITVHFERGEITDLSSSSIAVKGLDGVTTTFAMSTNTLVRQRGQEIKLTDLAVGQRALIAGTKNGFGAYDALLIRRLPTGLPGAAGTGASAQP